MKAIRLSFDEALLGQLDADSEVRKVGRSEVMRRAVAAYLRRRRAETLRVAYALAYGDRKGLRDDFAGWSDEGTS
jgi:metal-responsive CopG/Arc/MetJ family transcriptional regulator